MAEQKLNPTPSKFSKSLLDRIITTNFRYVEIIYRWKKKKKATL